MKQKIDYKLPFLDIMIGIIINIPPPDFFLYFASQHQQTHMFIGSSFNLFMQKWVLSWINFLEF